MTETAIILVHGRGPNPGPEHLRDTWVRALATRLPEGLQSQLPSLCHLAYYTDVFYNATTVAGGLHADLQAAVLARAYAQVAAFAVPPVPPANATAVGGDSAALFVEDVLKYFVWNYDGVIAQPVIRVLDEAQERGARIFLVSHSLGTLVTYDVLAGHPYHIDTWLTLGCPLGWTQGIWANIPRWLIDFVADLRTSPDRLTAVLDKSLLGRLLPRAGNPAASVEPPTTRIEYPWPSPQWPSSASVERWININDPDDPIAALDPFVAPQFLWIEDGSPRALDLRIANPGKRPGDIGSAHSDWGYLSSWAVATMLGDFLLRHQ